jgi:hypothetical protein
VSANGSRRFDVRPGACGYSLFARWLIDCAQDRARSRSLFASLWIVLVLTALVMAGAVAALAVADHFPPPSCLGTALPWFGFTGFMVCLISYLVLVALALGRGTRF